jgi:hypothetical protein
MLVNSYFERSGNAADRPSILEVSSMLKSETAALTIPQVPAFVPYWRSVPLKKFSINDALISQFVPPIIIVSFICLSYHCNDI